MSTLSQRLLHTSLAHRLGASSTTRQIKIPSDLARTARDLISSSKNEEDSNPIKPFDSGMVNPPHNFSQESLYPPETRSPRPPLLGPPSKIAKQIDPFHLAGSDPLDHIYNPAMTRAFINRMGRIKTRAETGLTWKNQRKVGKLVRRARAMGLLSQWTDRLPHEQEQ